MTSRWRRWAPVATLVLLTLAVTATSLGHDFTYDDRGVVFENPRVHSLANLPHLFRETYWPQKYGGDGYRPFMIALFILQWAVGQGAPWVFHLANIVLAVATTLAVFWCTSAVLPITGAWIAAALFAVHPVHVEVTGNVVGQSELIVALSLALAMGLYLRRRSAGVLSGRDVASISALFGIALFTKEHAIVLPGVMAAAELTVFGGVSWRERLRATRLLLLSLTAVALAYLYLRGFVQRDLTGFIAYPVFRFLNMRSIDRIGTMMNEIPRIAQLLVFPTRLRGDYSPADVQVANGFDVTQIPGLFICIGITVLAAVLRKRAPLASFGLFWLIVAFLPISNLIIPAGFVTAERTLFFPSIGVVLTVGAFAEYLRMHASLHRQRAAIACLTLLLIAGVARSIDRQRVWKNNDIFFETLMRDAPNGYRAHFMYARHVGRKSRLSQMEMEYRRAIRIFPYDASMTLAVADAYTRAGLCAPAIALFEWTFAVQRDLGEGRYEYVYCLGKAGRWGDVRREALNGLNLVPPREIRLMRQALRDAAVHLGSGGGRTGGPLGR